MSRESYMSKATITQPTRMKTQASKQINQCTSYEEYTATYWSSIMLP